MSFGSYVVILKIKQFLVSVSSRQISSNFFPWNSENDSDMRAYLIHLGDL